MIAIQFRFPAGGRYHSTAWGSHANEGVPEWPPSAWRLLRALIATARMKNGGDTAADVPELRELIETLAAAPAPEYRLPPAAAAHTRHFMPLGDGKRTKIFDTFVHPKANDVLTLLWKVELSSGQRDFLAALLRKMNYLGRAESLVEATLLPAEASLPSPNCRPALPGAPVGAEEQTLRLLAPLPPADYASWAGSKASPPTKAGKKKRAKAPPLPLTLFDALHLDTADWRNTGWSQPPGSRWMEYIRPAAPFQFSAPSRRHRSSNQKPGSLPSVARYQLQSPVPESITKALSLGERFHDALCSRSDALPVFSGRDGERKLSGHQHAFYLPECDERGRMTHVTVYAPMGFDREALQALRGLRATWSRHSPGLKLILLGAGAPEDFPDCPFFETAKVWRSLTPFVPTRHAKAHRDGRPKLDEHGRQIGSAAHDLCRLLGENGFPMPERVIDRKALQLPGRRLRWLAFQRERRKGQGTAVQSHSGYGFEIEFREPVRGPIAVGFGAHFGLGLFVPAGKDHPRSARQ